MKRLYFCNINTTLFILSFLLLTWEYSFTQGFITKELVKYLYSNSPRIVEQTKASKEFLLFGDTFRDDGVDKDYNGIEDNKDTTLLNLAYKFSPILYMNAYMVPLDFKSILKDYGNNNLYYQAFNISSNDPSYSRLYSMNLDSLNDWEPIKNILWNDSHYINFLQKESPDNMFFPILWFDFPGGNEESWRNYYYDNVERKIKNKFKDKIQIYVHPFIIELNNKYNGERDFEFVLQYWFFYPFNDGANDHEGDWEHINVVLANKLKNGHLTKEDIESLLNPIIKNNGISRKENIDSMIVIKRVEWFFHQYVFSLNYLEESISEFEIGYGRDIINDLKSQTIENGFHPVVYVGGEDIGVNLLLRFPGIERNQISGGSYPFPGLWKGIGGFNVFNEKINKKDEKGRTTFSPNNNRIVIIPDVECLNLKKEGVLENWCWIVFPVYFGFPIVLTSPGSNIEALKIGNIAPLGPTYNSGWNRVSTTKDYKEYKLNLLKAEQFSPVSEFRNDIGFINSIFFTTYLPIVDLVYSGSRLYLSFERSKYNKEKVRNDINNPKVNNNTIRDIFNIDNKYILTNGEKAYFHTINLTISKRYLGFYRNGLCGFEKLLPSPIDYFQKYKNFYDTTETAIKWNDFKSSKFENFNNVLSSQKVLPIFDISLQLFKRDYWSTSFSFQNLIIKSYPVRLIDAYFSLIENPKEYEESYNDVFIKADIYWERYVMKTRFNYNIGKVTAFTGLGIGAGKFKTKSVIIVRKPQYIDMRKEDTCDYNTNKNFLTYGLELGTQYWIIKRNNIDLIDGFDLGIEFDYEYFNQQFLQSPNFNNKIYLNGIKLCLIIGF